jgi:hypothetical protein
LSKAGRDWWKWAWSTPQATRWNKGDLYTIAHRAQLEDDLAALDALGGHFDLSDYIDVSEDQEELARALSRQIEAVKRCAGGKLGLVKECRELDNKLGLNPKGLADLRWSIAEPEETDTDREEQKPPADNVRALRPKKT